MLRFSHNVPYEGTPELSHNAVQGLGLTVWCCRPRLALTLMCRLVLCCCQSLCLRAAVLLRRSSQSTEGILETESSTEIDDFEL